MRLRQITRKSTSPDWHTRKRNLRELVLARLNRLVYPPLQNDLAFHRDRFKPIADEAPLAKQRKKDRLLGSSQAVGWLQKLASKMERIDDHLESRGILPPARVADIMASKRRQLLNPTRALRLPPLTGNDSVQQA